MRSVASQTFTSSRAATSRTAKAQEIFEPLSTRREGAALTIRGVAKAFGGVHAVENIDVDAARGTIHAIIGPNGAGKSTLLNLMSGIFRPDKGSIRVGDLPILRSRDLARAGIARTFQNLALFEGLTVAENVAMGRYAKRRAGLIAQFLGVGRAAAERKDVAKRLDAALAFLDLTELRDRRIGGLPYGIRKRIELARAIIAEPCLLLLDEPLAGMNGADKPEMARLIRTTRDTFGTTIVLVEHDLGVVMELADRITVLDHGRKIAEGTPTEVRRDPAVIAAYLGADHDEAMDNRNEAAA